MAGRTPAVTTADVRAANEKQSRQAQIAAQTAGRHRDGLSAGEAWEQDRAQELEESQKEEEARLHLKSQRRALLERKEVKDPGEVCGHHAYYKRACRVA